MDILITFVFGSIIPLIEIITKNDKAPAVAVSSVWSILFMLIGGSFSTLFYLLAKDVLVIPYVSNIYLKALLISMIWQVILRSKLFTVDSYMNNQEIEIGLEFFYNKFTQGIFKRIGKDEERRVMIEIQKLRASSKLSEKNIKKKAVEYIQYKVRRGKLLQTEADILIENIEKDPNEDAVINVDPIINAMWIVFEESDLETLKAVFSPINK